MRKTIPSQFIADRAWGALDIATIAGATVRLHWTDQPYIWHINTGQEVFVPLDGRVTMWFRHAGVESEMLLQPGEVCHAQAGDEHVAHPHGAVRILVIEQVGSI